MAVSRLIVFLIVALSFAIAAAAQEVAAEAPAVASDPLWLPIVLSLLSTIGGASILSSFISSKRWWMKIIDAFAFNFLKARNDPRVQ